MQHNASFRITDIQKLLFRLGITLRYIGFRYAEEALLLMKDDETRIFSVTKCLYPPIARKYSTSINAVERDIRTLSLVAWTKKREDLEELAGHSLDRRPTSTHFLAILYASLISE